MSEWHKHEGGRCPVDPETEIIARLRCLSRADVEGKPSRPAGQWPRWSHDNGPGDIVEWRLAQ